MLPIGAASMRACVGRFGAGVLAVACMAFPPPASAATFLWNSIVAGANWDTTTNWNPVGEPGAADNANIFNGFGPTVTSAGNNVSILNVGGSALGGTLSILTGGTLNVGTRTILGQGVGQTGTATVTGAGALLSTKELNIGESGIGSLSVSAGGRVTSTNLHIALRAGGVGTLLVDGVGSNVTASTFLRIGTVGTGTATVQNGATLNVTGSTGLLIGDGGTGTLNMLSGGQAMTTLVRVGNLAGSTGTLNVDGTGSALNATGTFYVGAAGTGTMNITDGGSVTGGNTIVGQAAGGGTSTVTIEGTGSTWTTAGLTVGSGHEGEVFASDGAVINSSGGIIGNINAPGFMEFDNATWNADNVTGQATIGVGAGNTGTLRLLNGSHAQTSNRLTVGGNGTNGNGTMLVDDSSFTLLPQTAGVQANTAEIGRDGGTGVLTIQNGSTVDLGQAQFQLGTRNTQSEGTLLVQGAGTTVTSGLFTVGQNGAGHFQLLDSAVMNTGNFSSGGNAAAIATSDGLIDNATLNVTGSGVGPAARLAVGGTASLTIQDGGEMNITGGDMEIAQLAGSNGTLTIGGTGGTLNVAQVIGGRTDALAGGAIVPGGNATVNFNHTNAGQTFAPRLRGYMTVNQMNTGTTVLTGDGDYFGNTNITGGTLLAGVTDAFSENSAYIMSGGLLDLDGFDNEIGSLEGTTNVTLGAGTLTTGSLKSTSYSGIISGSGGLTKTGQTVFTLDAAQPYTGATLVEAGVLRAGVADVIAASSGLTVNTGATFAMGGFDQELANLTNSGLVIFGAPANLLDINGNLAGGGAFAMQTQIDALTGNHIDVQGTSAGAHQLAILNAGGTPANLTDSLEVVQTTDGTATFALIGGTVDAGVYAYQLVRGDAIGLDPTAWYLTLSAEDTNDIVHAVVSTAAGMSNIWFSQMDNLHRRMGKQRLVDPAAHANECWARGYGRAQYVGPGVTGRPFSEVIGGVDAGCDRVLSYNDGDTWIGGAFAGYGGATRSFNDFGSKGVTHTPYAGLYATWFNENSYYADFTAKVHRFENAFDAQDGSGNIHSGAYSNWGYGGSAEFGRRFDMGGGWVLQPQGQIQYVRITGNSYTTQRGIEVSASPDNIWQLRGGLEFGQIVPGNGASNTYYYGRASLIEQLSTGGVITTDALVWDPSLDGLQFEFGAGVIHQFDDSRQGYLALTANIGQAFVTPWALNGGFRVEF